MKDVERNGWTNDLKRSNGPVNQDLSVSIHLYCSGTVDNKQRMQSPQNS